MKYLLLAAFIISCFAISCDDQKEIVNTGTTVETNVYDKDDVEAIISKISSSSREDNVGEWEGINDVGVEAFAGQQTHTSSNADVCTPRAGLCGPCQGFCETMGMSGNYELTGVVHTDNGVLSQSKYNAGYRLFTISIIRHKQTGTKKVLIDFKHHQPYLYNNRLYLRHDTWLSSQLTQRLNHHNIVLKAGTYAATFNTATGNAQTVIDAIIQ